MFKTNNYMSFPTPIKLISKAEVKEIATKHGCQTSYDGQDRIMYIYNGNSAKALAEIHELTGERHFTVRTKHTRCTAGI
jgi:hypothetical protein